jgi:hypothetical protein
MCFGGGDDYKHRRPPPPLLSSRGVLKWHSLLKVHLAINDFDFRLEYS